VACSTTPEFESQRIQRSFKIASSDIGESNTFHWKFRSEYIVDSRNFPITADRPHILALKSDHPGSTGKLTTEKKWPGQTAHSNSF
jgi:hypothetical protein